MAAMSIKHQLQWAFLWVSVLPILLVGYFGTVHYEQSLRAMALQNLSAIADKKVQQIDNFLNVRIADAGALALRPRVLDIVTRAPNPTDGGEQVALAADTDTLFALVAERAYRDLLLVDARGRVVATQNRSIEGGTDLREIPWRDTGLAEGVRQAMTQHDSLLNVAQPYGPLSDLPTAFIVAAVMRGQHAVGAVVLVLDLGQLDQVVGDASGLGKTGYSWVGQHIGDTVASYSSAPQRKNGGIRTLRMSSSELSEPRKAALAGSRGEGSSLGADDIAVVAAWRPLPQLNAGIVVQQEESEVLADVVTLQRFGLAVIPLLLLGSAAMAWLMGRRIVQPIRELMTATRRLADAQQDARVDACGWRECCELGHVFNGMAQAIEATRGRPEVHANSRANELEAWFDNSPDRMFRFGFDGTIVDGWFGRTVPPAVSRQSFVGASIWSLMPSDDAAACQRALDAVAIGLVPDPFEYVSPRPDGTRHYEVRAIRDGDLHALLLLRDVTPSVLARDRLAQLANVVREMGTTRSLEGLLAVLRNSACELIGAQGMMLGLVQNGVPVCVVADGITPCDSGETAPANAVDLQTCLQAHNARRPAQCLQHMQCAPIAQGASEGMLACFWTTSQGTNSDDLRIVRALADAVAMGLANVGLFHELDSARRAAERLGQVKTEFLANMSHEIRTPVHAVLGLTYLALGAEPNDAARTYLSDIREAGNLLLGIINDVLDVSRIEDGRVVIEPVGFEIASFCDSALSHVRAAAVAKRLSLTLYIASDVPRALVGDSARLMQVAVNLLTNSVKFTKQGGVALSVKFVEPRGVDQVLLRFEVRDTGIGISQSQQSHLFQRFHQVDQSVTREYGGSGLGLVISKGLLELMGGDIGLESDLGRGSTFWFTVVLGKGLGNASDGPLVLTPPAAVPVSSHAPPDTARATTASSAVDASTAGPSILLVEDNRINRKLACEMLTKLGCVVDIAEDGEVAVSKARLRLYDLVLMDVQMPVMDGIAATALIRSLPGWASVPIIALTGNAMAANRERCLASGMDGFVTKPFSPAMLRNVLEQWLSVSAPTEPNQ